jgi:LacI family transcriptional regulator
VQAEYRQKRLVLLYTNIPWQSKFAKNPLDKQKKICIIGSTGNVTGNIAGNITGTIMMTNQKRSVTIIDVAEAAGVSVSTVSRVLNDKDDVSAATYQRVSQVIDELGYSSSLAARSMRSRTTNVIGLIMPDVDDPFSVEVIRGVNRAIVELQYDLLIYTNGDIPRNISASKEQQYVTLLNSSITDGVIIVTPVSCRFRSISPVVSVDPNIDNPAGPAVIATNLKGARDAMEHLLELGHSRIGYIGGRTDLLSAHLRLEAYKQALDQAGIPQDHQLITSGDFKTETAMICAHQLLSLDEPPTAIFASNDQSAIGVIIVAETLGIRIPEDLSLVGFDNIPEAAYLDLTTIDQNINQMGYIGTKMLIDLIQGKTLDKALQKIETKLIIRGTTRHI